ncbi:hypothetical protein ABPG72_001902 [Tetrahymena utriculariae]
MKRFQNQKINKIIHLLVKLVNMVNPDQDQRLEPIQLFLNIQKFKVNENSLKNLKLSKSEAGNMFYENELAKKTNNDTFIQISQNLNGINFEESYNYSEKGQQKQQLTAIYDNTQMPKNQNNKIQTESKKLKRKSFGKFLQISQKKILSDCQEVELKYQQNPLIKNFIKIKDYFFKYFLHHYYIYIYVQYPRVLPFSRLYTEILDIKIKYKKCQIKKANHVVIDVSPQALYIFYIFAF